MIYNISLILDKSILPCVKYYLMNLFNLNFFYSTKQYNNTVTLNTIRQF